MAQQQRDDSHEYIFLKNCKIIALIQHYSTRFGYCRKSWVGIFCDIFCCCRFFCYLFRKLYKSFQGLAKKGNTFQKAERLSHDVLNNKWILIKKIRLLCISQQQQKSKAEKNFFRVHFRTFFFFFLSLLFLCHMKYHEFNIIMGQVSDLWCMLKYSTYVQFFILFLA